jgi:tetratricopeptide (TPR) repeat protein
MAVLDLNLQVKIDELTDLAYTQFEEGNTEESFKLLKQAWNTYPDPKEKWNEAYNTAKYVFLDYMSLQNLTEAKIWLNNMIDVNNNLHLNNEDCYFNYGKYQYEIKDFKDAYDKFHIVVEEAGFRYFENEDPKYLEFYKNPEKYFE